MDSRVQYAGRCVSHSKPTSCPVGNHGHPSGLLNKQLESTSRKLSIHWQDWLINLPSVLLLVFACPLAVSFSSNAQNVQHLTITQPGGMPSQPALTGILRGSNNATLTWDGRSEEHTSELQSLRHLVCRLLL